MLFWQKISRRLQKTTVKTHNTVVVVPSYSDVELADEFDNVKQLAKDNRMLLNFSKTKDIVFRRVNPKLIFHPTQALFPR